MGPQILLGVVPAMMAFVYAIVVLPPQRWASHTSGGLMGEMPVQNSKDAHNVAEEVVAEAFDLWDEPSSNWQVMHNNTNLLVEARRITEGPYRNFRPGIDVKNRNN